MPGITFLNFQHLSTSASKTEAAIPFSSAEHSLVLCLCIPGSKEAKYCPQSTARCSHECGFSGSGIARRLGTTPPREPGRSFPLKGDDGRQVTRAEGKKTTTFIHKTGNTGYTSPCHVHLLFSHIGFPLTFPSLV